MKFKQMKIKANYSTVVAVKFVMIGSEIIHIHVYVWTNNWRKRERKLKFF